MSIDTKRQKYKDLSSIKTDQGRVLLLCENMTLPYSISRVTDPLEIIVVPWLSLTAQYKLSQRIPSLTLC